MGSPKGKNKVNVKKVKQEMVKAFSKLKKANNGKEVYLNDFTNKTGHTRYELVKVFGSFSKLREEGDAHFRKTLPVAQRALLSELSKKFIGEATKDDCIEDLRSVASLNSLGTVTRNFYRENGKYSDSTWNRYFGTFQEFRRQAGLELSRQQHKLEREVAKHAAQDHYKKFTDTQLMPYYKKYEKPQNNEGIKTIMVISDLHDKECCDFTLATFISECLRKQPDIICLNGDIFDLYEFSRYTKDPREYDIRGRFEYVWDKIFKPLREACPDAQIDMIIGNHEFRLIRLLADVTPNLRILMHDVLGLELKDVFKLDDYQINLVSKFDLSAFSSKDINNELKKNYQIYYGCYVVCHEPDKNLMIMSGTNGHHHRLEHRSNAFPDPATGKVHQVTWVQTPAGHRKNAEYIQNLCKWNTGFLEVIVNTESKEVIQRIHQTCSDWTVIDGILYRRLDE